MLQCEVEQLKNAMQERTVETKQEKVRTPLNEAQV
jgi:hypothetical protein